MRRRRSIRHHGTRIRSSSKRWPRAWATHLRGWTPPSAHEPRWFSPRTASRRRWTVAYQSRSGNPRDPWLAPDVTQVLRGLAGRTAVVMPIGFICDHVEVLYDLDVEAAAAARAGGAAMVRAATVGDHPLFIRMIAQLLKCDSISARNT